MFRINVLRTKAYNTGLLRLGHILVLPNLTEKGARCNSCGLPMSFRGTIKNLVKIALRKETSDS